MAALPLLVAVLLSSNSVARFLSPPLLSLSPPLILIKRHVSEVPPGVAEGACSCSAEKRNGNERSSPAEKLAAYLEKRHAVSWKQAPRTRSQPTPYGDASPA